MSKLARIIDRLTGRDVLIKSMQMQVSTMQSALARALGGQSVSYWSSNHAKEADQYDGWTYCAISSIVDQASQFEVFPEEIRESNHPMFPLLYAPNPWQAKGEFNGHRVLQLCLTGVGVVWNRPIDGMIQRYVVPTALATPQPDGFKVTAPPTMVGGWSEMPSPIYSMYASTEFIPYQQCTIYRLPHPIFVNDGKSPVAAASKWVDIMRQMDEARYTANANAPRPGLKITESEMSDMSPEDREALKAEMKAEYSGAKNSGKNFWLPKGLTAEPWQAGPLELDHVNSIPQVRDSILSAFRTPPVVVGLVEAGSHAAYYAALLQFTELRMQPLANLLSDGDRRTFLALGYDVPEEFAWKARRVDAPDLKENRAMCLKTTGVGSVNEIRQILDMPPLGDIQDRSNKYNQPVFEIFGTDDMKLKDLAKPGEGKNKTVDELGMDETGTGITTGNSQK